MVEIIPTILTGDVREIIEKFSRLEGLSGRVQIDIIDGQFAQNKTVDPSALETLDTTLNLDFHLMTKEPIDWIERAVRGGAERIIGQIERMSDQAAYLGKVQELGKSAGLAIDIDTPVSSFDPTILSNFDVVLVMSVKAGQGGQKFDERAVLKVKQLDKIRAKDGSSFRICVDGGITPEIVTELTKAGADEIAVGGRLFEGDLAVNIEKYRKT